MNEFSISLNGATLKLNMSGNGSVTVNEKEYKYEIIPLHNSDFILRLSDRIYQIHFTPVSVENYQITVNGKLHDLTIRTALQERAAKLIEKSVQGPAGIDIKAPMPGMVLKIKKSVSEPVHQGESLLILEAMKMENELRSPVSGIIKNIYVQEGSPVEKGALLFSIESS